MRPDFPHRRIKTHARQMAGSIRGRDGKGSLMPEDEVQEVAMRDFNPLGPSCRARRIDYVREILACYPNRLSQRCADLNRTGIHLEINYMRSTFSHAGGHRTTRD